jgi:hypothetical protein
MVRAYPGHKYQQTQRGIADSLQWVDMSAR